jgi:hypothetical protein
LDASIAIDGEKWPQWCYKSNFGCIRANFVRPCGRLDEVAVGMNEQKLAHGIAQVVAGRFPVSAANKSQNIRIRFKNA